MATYSIKDLERLSGIKAHTLRIWEKRYGVLDPDRTDTNIRSYCDKDLRRILNISILNKNGYKISKIAALGDHEREKLVLEITRQKQSVPENAFDQLIIHMMNLNEKGFNTVFQDLIDTNGIEETFRKVIFPFLERIGVLWQVGTIIPAQEHFISNLIRQKLITAIDALPYPDSAKVEAVLFLPEHYLHELGLLFYHYYLKKKGVKSIYLGQAVPYDDIVLTMQKFEPKYSVSSWVAPVAIELMDGFFKKLDRALEKNDIVVEHLCGGSQVQQYSKELKSEVKFISNSSSIDNYIK